MYQVPLEQEHSSSSSDEEYIGMNPTAKSNPVKFVRFRCTKTRISGSGNGGNGGPVALGSFSLWVEGSNKPVDYKKAKASNPMGTWKGEVKDLVEFEGMKANAGFRDRAGTPLVIAFQNPLPLNGFSWKTPIERGTESSDPVRWKLEGSPNGTYWFTLHEQARDYPTPLERGWRLPLFRFDGQSPLFR
jgi:hypothetical protein